MARTALFVVIFALARNASADCDLRYAPPEVRAAAQAFHHHASERRPSSANNAARAAIQRVPRLEQAERPAATAEPEHAPLR